VSPDPVQAAVLAALESLNETLPPGDEVRLEADASLRDLESLAITNLVIAVEEAVWQHLRAVVSLTDDRTLGLLESEDLTPLRTVRTLTDHVRRLLAEDAG
jgi:hypothetical protein